MEAIETMRNCVAHNRRPLQRVTNNYLNVLPQVLNMLDTFLAHWAVDSQGKVGNDEIF
jgi:hypothetical protein